MQRPWLDVISDQQRDFSIFLEGKTHCLFDWKGAGETGRCERGVLDVIEMQSESVIPKFLCLFSYFRILFPQEPLQARHMANQLSRIPQLNEYVKQALNSMKMHNTHEARIKIQSKIIFKSNHGAVINSIPHIPHSTYQWLQCKMKL